MGLPPAVCPNGVADEATLVALPAAAALGGPAAPVGCCEQQPLSQEQQLKLDLEMLQNEVFS